MNNFDRGVEFNTGSQGNGPMEIAEQERVRHEREEQEMIPVLNELGRHGCKELSSYLGSLSLEQRQKVDAGLNVVGRGMDLFKWTEPDQEAEILGLLDEIEKSNDNVAINNASKRIESILAG